MTRLHLGFYCCCMILGGADAYASSQTFFGQDLNPNPGNSATWVNANSAKQDFFALLTGVLTESFEGLPLGELAGPTNISFGPDVATLVPGGGSVTVSNAFGGTFPTTGTKDLLVGRVSAGASFEIEFSSPQAAFGFYGTDVGDIGSGNQLTVALYDEADVFITSFAIPHGFGSAQNGSILYFGVIDTDTLFSKVELINAGSNEDGFGFDDLTIGRLRNVLSGDYNNNGVVDAADYVVWRDTQGMTGLEPYELGDGNGDGEVTATDYNVWRGQFGQTLPSSPAGTAEAVPEPTSLTLFATVVLLSCLPIRIR